MECSEQKIEMCLGEYSSSNEMEVSPHDGRLKVGKMSVKSEENYEGEGKKIKIKHMI
jgi:hypothetical protein